MLKINLITQILIDLHLCVSDPNPLIFSYALNINVIIFQFYASLAITLLHNWQNLQHILMGHITWPENKKTYNEVTRAAKLPKAITLKIVQLWPKFCSHFRFDLKWHFVNTKQMNKMNSGTLGRTDAETQHTTSRHKTKIGTKKHNLYFHSLC